MVERAQLAVERGDLPTAKTLFEAVIGDPAHPAGTIVRAAIQRADLAQREGDLEGAQRFLDQADRAGVPEALAPAWAYRRGLVLRARGETEPAREVFRSVVDRFASSEFARACLLNLAEIAFETEPAQAIPLYEQLLARGDAGSYAPLASLRLAQTRLKLGEWEEAARLASELQSGSVDAGTKNEAVYVLARVHQQKAEFDQARELYRSIIGPERTETAAKAQFMLAETLFLQERWNEAVKEFLKVAILYPIPEWQSLAMVEVGKCYSRQSQITEAKKTFEEVIERYSQLPAAEEARKQLQLLETSPSKG
jgi:TolA-binding protein